MIIGILSDTHDNVAAIREAVSIFEDENVDTVLHCGDFIAPPTIPFFDGFEVHGVLGNNDGEVAGLESAFADLGADSDLHGRFADLEFDGRRFAILHGESMEEVETYADSGDYDYVCYGHHHERDERTVGATTVINPGGHFPTIADDHRTIAILDTETDELTFVGVDGGRE